MDTVDFKKLYETYKATSLYGRYITNTMIAPLVMSTTNKEVEAGVIGHSVENKPIYSLKIGKGAIKVLLWSQMHGNESTTTKALFDMLNTMYHSEVLNTILKTCTLYIIPILNPDGAAYYTRLNANAIDLNRDAQQLSQPESKVLRDVFDTFKPHFCFNLHGQRTIFGTEGTDTSATVSFLSPAENAERSLTDTRKQAMAIIAQIYKGLKMELVSGIGRYDDSYNRHCVGDTFQALKVPTVLFEAGHYPEDYQREKTRFYIFKALIVALNYISKGVRVNDYHEYFDIPENRKNFYDIIIRNAQVETQVYKDVAIQFKEHLKDGVLDFCPVVESISDLSNYYGHREIDAKGSVVYNSDNVPLKVADEIVFVMLNNYKVFTKP